MVWHSHRGSLSTHPALRFILGDPNEIIPNRPKPPSNHYQGGSRKQSHPSKQHIPEFRIPWLHDKSPTKIHMIIHVDYMFGLHGFHPNFILTKQKPTLLNLQNMHINIYIYISHLPHGWTKNIQVSCKLRFPPFLLDENHLQFRDDEILLGLGRCHRSDDIKVKHHQWSETWFP